MTSPTKPRRNPWLVLGAISLILLLSLLAIAVALLVMPPGHLPTKLPNGWTPGCDQLTATWTLQRTAALGHPLTPRDKWKLVERESDSAPFLACLSPTDIQPGYKMLQDNPLHPNARLPQRTFDIIIDQEPLLRILTTAPQLVSLRWDVQRLVLGNNKAPIDEQRPKIVGVYRVTTLPNGDDSVTVLTGDLAETLQVEDGEGFRVYQLEPSVMLVCQVIQRGLPEGFSAPDGLIRIGLVDDQSTGIEWLGWIALPHIEHRLNSLEKPQPPWVNHLQPFLHDGSLYFGANIHPRVGLDQAARLFWTRVEAPAELPKKSQVEPLPWIITMPW